MSYLDAINEISKKTILPGIQEQLLKENSFLAMFKKIDAAKHYGDMRLLAEDYGYPLWRRR